MDGAANGNGTAKTVPVTESLEQLREGVERQRLTLQKRVLESQTVFLDQMVDPRDQFFDANEFWLPLGADQNVPWNIDDRKRGEVLPVYLNEYGLKWIRDQSRRICVNNEFAINAIENRVSYLTGKGFTYRAVLRRDDPSTPGNEKGSTKNPLCQAVQDVLDEFLDSSNWSAVEQESVRRADRDGEAFIRLFPQPSGETLVRWVQPEHVRVPPGQPHTDRDYLFGVETPKNDVQNVLAYWVVDDPETMMARDRVSVADMVHIKFNVDATAKRGLPTMFPVRKNLDRAEKLLRNMTLMANVQSTFALIRKHKQYSVQAVQQFADAQMDFSYSAPATGRQQRFTQLQPGSIVDIPEGTDYEFPAGAVNAGAFVEILKAELRAIASRLGMPEYMLTADSGGANYASTLVAESPFVKLMERIQAYLGQLFGGGVYRSSRGGRLVGVMWRVLRNAVVAGRLPREVLREVEIQAEGPSLVVRDKLQEAQKNQVLSMAGILSPQTWTQQETLDYDREQQNIEEHKDRTGGGAGQGLGDLGFPGMGGGGGQDFGEPPPPDQGAEDAAGAPPDMGLPAPESVQEMLEGLQADLPPDVGTAAVAVMEEWLLESGFVRV